MGSVCPVVPFLLCIFFPHLSPPMFNALALLCRLALGSFFLLAGLIANGAYDDVTIARSVVIVPLFMVGNWLGRYVFRIAPSTWFKKATIGILFATGISVLAL